jgi:hypothetical protein
LIRRTTVLALALSVCVGHAQTDQETAYCQRQAEYEYRLRIGAPPIFPEVFPGQNGGQAGQAAAYASAWSQRVFMECLRRQEADHRLMLE